MAGQGPGQACVHADASGARPLSSRTADALLPPLSVERKHPAAGLGRRGGHSRVRVARCPARQGRSALETLAAWREGRRHRLDPALHALSADERHRVPQGRRALAVRDRQPPRARPQDGRAVRGYPATRKPQIACASRSNRASASPGSSPLTLAVGLALTPTLTSTRTLTLALRVPTTS